MCLPYINEIIEHIVWKQIKHGRQVQRMSTVSCLNRNSRGSQTKEKEREDKVVGLREFGK